MQQQTKKTLLAASLVVLVGMLAIAAGIFISNRPPPPPPDAPKTNRAYLKEIIDSHSAEKAAKALVQKLKLKNAPIPLGDDDWKAAEDGLAACIDSEQRKYLNSDDPYLDQIADEHSTETLATKFLKSCDAL